jgi:esterase/lipase superfamily enzyme
MFLITNRNVEEGERGFDRLGPRPNPLGPNELRLAEARRTARGWTIDVLPDECTDEMLAEVGLERPIGPDGRPQPVYASRYVTRKILARVNPRAVGSRAKGRNLLLFVHGFNNDVEAVIERAATFADLYGVEVIAFTWPANGGGLHGVASYLSDKRDARASVGAFERTLGKMHAYLREVNDAYVEEIRRRATEQFADAERRDRFIAEQMERGCPFTVNLALHSMGNYLYKQLLKSSLYQDVLLFDNVVMVAADANNEGHVEWVDRIRARKRIYITINENDGALMASRMKAGEEQLARLGHHLHGLESRQATYLDVTGAPGVGDSHAYFEGSPIERNAELRELFRRAFNGEIVEDRLEYDVAKNVYRIRRKRGK